MNTVYILITNNDESYEDYSEEIAAVTSSEEKAVEKGKELSMWDFKIEVWNINKELVDTISYFARNGKWYKE